MPAAPHPPNEAGRVEALTRSGALDASSLLGLERIAAEAAHEGDAPIALVSFIGADRQWVKASVGARMADTDRDSAFCAWAIYNADVLWVEDALQDVRFCDNPLVTGEPRIRHYAGAPIVTPEGFALGAVCVIDSKPHAFDPAVAPKLVALAERVSKALDEASPRFGLRKGSP